MFNSQVFTLSLLYLSIQLLFLITQPGFFLDVKSFKLNNTKYKPLLCSTYSSGFFMKNKHIVGKNL